MGRHREGANITDSAHLVCPFLLQKKSWKVAKRSMEDRKKGQELACFQYIRKKKRKEVKKKFYPKTKVAKTLILILFHLTIPGTEIIRNSQDHVNGNMGRKNQEIRSRGILRYLGYLRFQEPLWLWGRVWGPRSV